MEYLIELNIYNFINNQNINLKFDKKINILIGKNGCGKTTIFRIIDKLLDNNYSELISEPFDEIALSTSKREIRLKKIDKRTLSLKVEDTEKLIDVHDFYLEHYKDKITSNTNEISSFKNHIFIPLTRSYSSMNNQNNSYGFSLEELERIIERRYRLFLMQVRDIDNKFKGKTIGIPLKIRNKIDVSSNVSKIFNFNKEKQEQIRAIFRNLDSAPTENLLNTLFKEIEDTKILLSKYNITSYAQLLSNYVQTLTLEIDNKNVVNKNKEIEKVFRFVTYDFSFEFLESLLELFKTTEEEKKKPFISFKNFEETLNSFFYENRKRIHISQTGELKIESLINNKNKLNIHDLSSGEKQLITLFGYIIFDVKKEKIILIDEPELSLHIDWQMKFTESLMKLDSEKQYFLATHSPEIIGEYEDKCLWIGEDRC